MRTSLAVTRIPFTTGSQGELKMLTTFTATKSWQAAINIGIETGVLGHEF